MHKGHKEFSYMEKYRENIINVVSINPPLGGLGGNEGQGGKKPGVEKK
jgi:hypothetical protein